MVWMTILTVYMGTGAEMELSVILPLPLHLNELCICQHIAMALSIVQVLNKSTSIAALLNLFNTMCLKSCLHLALTLIFASNV